jgi:hypothetical protein
MPGLKIHAASVLFPWEREKNRVGRHQKGSAFNFPMQMALGDVMKLESPVLMFWQPRDAAAAKFLKKIKKSARFSGKLPDHVSQCNRPKIARQGRLKTCVLFTAGNMGKQSCVSYVYLNLNEHERQSFLTITI